MTISKTGSKIVSLWLAAALVSGLFAIMPLSVSAAPLGLSAPENVKWNDAERCVAEWDAVDTRSYTYQVYLYRDGEQIRSSRAGYMMGQRAGRDFSNYIDKLGTYYFTVYTVGDGLDYEDSPTVRSDDLVIDSLPEEQLPAPQNLTAEPNADGDYVVSWSPIAPHKNLSYYNVSAGVTRESGNEWLDGGDTQETQIIFPKDLFDENGIYWFGVQAVTNNLFECRSSEYIKITKTIGIPQPPVVIPPGPGTITSGGDGNSSSGSGGGGGGGGGNSGSTANTTQVSGSTVRNSTSAPLTQANAISVVSHALRNAGSDGAVVKLQNVSDVSLDVLQAMSNTAKNTPLTIHADSTRNGVVDVRITLDPANATKSINLSASTVNNDAERTNSTFGKFFSNDVMTVCLGQKGSFGMTVKIAAKIAPALNTDNLVFYLYDSATNSYQKIANPKHRTDSNGYVHFSTSQAGNIVISNGPLQ